MHNVIEYKGIKGFVEYMPDRMSFMVRAVGTAESYFAHGDTPEEFVRDFEKETDSYLERCEQLKIDPKTMPYGKITHIKIDPKIHEQSLLMCKLKHISIDEFIQEALDMYLKH